MKIIVTTLASLSMMACAAQVSAQERVAATEPVPSWAAGRCCRPSEAHHLSADQVHVTPDGYRIDGYSHLVREDRLQMSQDGSWWLFYRTAADGTQSPASCFFGPNRGS